MTGNYPDLTIIALIINHNKITINGCLYICEEFACFESKVSVGLIVSISYFHSEFVKCAERLEVSCCYVC